MPNKLRAMHDLLLGAGAKDLGKGVYGSPKGSPITFGSGVAGPTNIEVVKSPAGIEHFLVDSGDAMGGGTAADVIAWLKDHGKLVGGGLALGGAALPPSNAEASVPYNHTLDALKELAQRQREEAHYIKPTGDGSRSADETISDISSAFPNLGRFLKKFNDVLPGPVSYAGDIYSDIAEPDRPQAGFWDRVGGSLGTALLALPQVSRRAPISYESDAILKALPIKGGRAADMVERVLPSAVDTSITDALGVGFLAAPGDVPGYAGGGLLKRGPSLLHGRSPQEVFEAIAQAASESKAAGALSRMRDMLLAKDPAIEHGVAGVLSKDPVTWGEVSGGEESVPLHLALQSADRNLLSGALHSHPQGSDASFSSRFNNAAGQDIGDVELAAVPPTAAYPQKLISGAVDHYDGASVLRPRQYIGMSKLMDEMYGTRGRLAQHPSFLDEVADAIGYPGTGDELLRTPEGSSMFVFPSLQGLNERGALDYFTNVHPMPWAGSSRDAILEETLKRAYPEGYAEGGVIGDEWQNFMDGGLVR